MNINYWKFVKSFPKQWTLNRNKSFNNNRTNSVDVQNGSMGYWHYGLLFITAARNLSRPLNVVSNHNRSWNVLLKPGVTICESYHLSVFLKRMKPKHGKPDQSWSLAIRIDYVTACILAHITIWLKISTVNGCFLFGFCWILEEKIRKNSIWFRLVLY